jgi:hypothetical protein
MIAAAWLVLLCPAPAGAADGFTVEPAAERDGRRVRITFTAARPTDAAVWIENAKGEAVRHLAAGRLGKTAPAPLQANSLAQELVWDGTDDAGKAAAGRPLRVRVGLGLRAGPGRVIGWSGQQPCGVCGFTTGPEGTLYVIAADSLYAHRITWVVAAFGRDGTYLRQLYPGPANLPPEKREGWPRFRRADGAEVPVVFHVLSRSVYPGAVFHHRMFPLVTTDGRLIVLSGAPQGTIIKHPDVRGGRRLLILGTDGSVPENFLGPVVCGNVGGFGHIALSPDEKTVYVTGLVDTGRKGKGPQQVVYRVPLDGSAKSEVLIGALYKAGTGQAGLNDPQGIATDADGNVYVGDYGNDRVAVFKPDGSYLDEIPVEHPDTVCVSRKTGAVYVVQLEKRKYAHTHQWYYPSSHNWKVKRIVKFGGLKDKTQKATFMKTFRSRWGGGGFLTLDESGDRPVLWVSGLTYGGGPIVQVVDHGDRIVEKGMPLRARISKAEQALPGIGDVALIGDKLLAHLPTFGNARRPTALVYDARTGEPKPIYTFRQPGGKKENYWNLVYGEVTSGKDGRLYVHAGDTLRRYGPDGKALPFESTGTHVLKGLEFDRHTHTSTLFADTDGNVYIAHRAEGKGQARDKDVVLVSVIGPDGKMKKRGLIRVQGARLGGLAVDRAGNVYLGAQVYKEFLPAWAKGRLPKDGSGHSPSLAYMQAGAVVRFPPEGGAIALDPKGAYRARRGYRENRVSVTGALLTRAGLIPGKAGKLGAGCNCGVSRFDLDAFGRIYVPDVFRFCVLVIDREGNELVRIGSYGNMDSRGPGSPVPEPAVPLGWPLTARVGLGRVVVADVVNRRVVSAELQYEVTADCPVR